MKNFSALLAVAVLGFTIACSKSAAEAEAKAIINDMVKAAETAAEKLDKAATAKEAADVMKAFKAEMATLAKKGEEFDKKHPGISVKDGPAFKSERDAFMNSMKKYGISSMKVRIRFNGAKELADQDKK